MKELLSRENLEYIAKAKEIAEKHIKPLAAEMDREQRYPWEIIKELQKADLMGVWIPKEYGGLGAGVLNLCLVAEELSKACGGVGIAYAVNALGSFPILLAGTEEQKQKYLPDIAKGKKLIAFGLSELDAGSDTTNLKTRAVKDGDSYIINGNKKWTTNAGAADIYSIFCVTDPVKGTRGVSALIVEKGTPGFEIGKAEDKMGIRCVSVHELHFKDCSVKAENLLGGKEGAGYAACLMTLDRARPGVAAQALGLAEGAFDLALDYARKRRQFNDVISSFQAIQFMLADMATQIEAARHLVYACAQAIDAGVKNISKIASMAKVFASDVAMKVTTDAVQIFGGYGYMKDYPIEKFMRDAKITQIYEGTNQIQRIVIARNLLKEAAGR